MSGFDAFTGDTPAALELTRLVERAQRAFAWRGEVDALTARASVEGVTAIVTGAGSIQSLRIEDRACADGGQALADRVMDAVQQAQGAVSEEVMATARRTFGEDAPELATIEASLASRRHVQAAASGEDQAAPSDRA